MSLSFISLVQVATLFILAWQLFVLHKTFRADHERMKKQATIEFVGPAWRESRFQVESILGTKRLTEEKLEKLVSDLKTEATQSSFLNTVEHLSVGLNTGVYDKEILYRMSGSLLVVMYDRYEPYITLSRRKFPKAYIEYEQIAMEFKERKRNNPSKNGNIQHS